MATMYSLLLGVLLTALCPIVGAGDAAVAWCVKAQRRGFADLLISDLTNRRINASATTARRHPDWSAAEQRDLQAMKACDFVRSFDYAQDDGKNSREDAERSRLRRRHPDWSAAEQRDLTIALHPFVRATNHIGESANTQYRKIILAIAAAELGVRETTGRNDGQRVEQYLRYTGLGKGHPWCAAFASWCFGQAGLPQPRTPWSPALFPNARTYYRNGKFVDLKSRESENQRISDLTNLPLYGASPSGLRSLHCGRDDGESGRDDGRRMYQRISALTNQRIHATATTTRRPPDWSAAQQRDLTIGGRFYVEASKQINTLTNQRIYAFAHQRLHAFASPADIFGIYGKAAKRINHVGLVKERQGKYLITIEGNSNDRVESRRRHLSTIYALADWL